MYIKNLQDFATACRKPLALLHSFRSFHGILLGFFLSLLGETKPNENLELSFLNEDGQAGLT